MDLDRLQALADVAASEGPSPGGAPPGSTRGVPARRKQEGSSSRFTGVTFNKSNLVWQTSLWDTQTKRNRHVGNFASEEDAARAYDCAAVQSRGPCARRNFPREAISELPETVGGERKPRKSSLHIGVAWDKAESSWRAQLTDPLTKRQRYIGSFASEEDAARAYDFAAVQAHGPVAKRNFPGEAINELPETVGGERKQRSTRNMGVFWHKAKTAWQVEMRDPQTKREQSDGSFVSEEDAARAHGSAAHGRGAKRKSPDEAISEMPLAAEQ
ncbi:hypothetical protein FOA52_012882 [Chlamydomonas sp. UWO 241]|nr:hypothetical protein FOA52_012882 [Chlamydomonas sp. UWO 241]